jgi:hypothetical protein
MGKEWDRAGDRARAGDGNGKEMEGQGRKDEALKEGREGKDSRGVRRAAVGGARQSQLRGVRRQGLGESQRRHRQDCLAYGWGWGRE